MAEQADSMKLSLDQPVKVDDIQASVPYSRGRSNTAVLPQEGMGGCSSCGGNSGTGFDDSGTISYVYAIGRVEVRFPSLAAEKEFAQATGRTETAGKTDQQAFHAVLSERQNRYLARQLCWVLTIQGLETYLLQPRDPADIDM